MAVQNQEKTSDRERVWQRRVERLKRRACRRRWLNAFLVWHVCAVAAWLLPHGWPVVRALAPPDNGGPVRAYLTLTNFGQDWKMFAPEPDRRDQFVRAAVTLADGQTRLWTFPRMSDLGYAERYRRERFRKLVEASGRDFHVWPALARYAARRVAAAEPHNPPVLVTLVRHFRDVPPPGRPLPPFQSAPFFGLRVTPEDLR